MVHILLIAVFVSAYLRDGLRRPLLHPWLREWSPTAIAAWSIGSLVAVWLVAHAAIWLLGRGIDRRGSFRAAQRAEAVLLASRLSLTLIHAFNVLCIGWLDWVRSWTGNIVALDELLASLPVIIAFVLGWWSLYPIDRRVREAVIIHELDSGRAMPPILSRGEYVIGAMRHQACWVLVPIVSILIWSETVEWAMRRGWIPSGEAAMVGIQILGLIVILSIMPLALRRVWDTVTLGAGPLRERLMAMCREQRVRVRDLLIWRTHGTMVNGAVMGVVRPIRYILLTDALIEYLPPEQVEAVTAHEIGHVRRRHMLWLALGALGTVTVVGAVIQVGLELARPGLSGSIVAQAAAGVVSLGLGLLIFGYISRRFEWQADAFAVQHLSGHKPGSGPGVLLTGEAVAAMRGALEAVARLNHIPRTRFTWRHGSIATRQRRLTELVGLRADRLAIDRQARVLAIASAAVGMLAAGLIAWAGVSSPPRPRAADRPQGTEVLGAIRQDAWDRERLHLP